jgi:HEAT repeat protein
MRTLPFIGLAALLILLGGAGRGDRLRAYDAPDAETTGKARLDKLIQQLRDSKDSKQRADAARQMGQLGSEAKPAVDDLLKASNDPDPDVAFAATNALGYIGRADRNALQDLIQALKSSDPKRVAAAAMALESVGPSARDAVPILRGLVTDTRDGIAEHAIDALGEIGPSAKDAVVELRQILQSLKKGNLRLQIAALNTLCKIGPGAHEAVPDILKVLGDPNAAESSRAQAAEALAGIASHARSDLPHLQEIIEGLVAALRVANPTIRKVAATALGRIGSEARDAIDALAQRLRQDPVGEVRVASAEALGNIGTGSRPVVEALQLGLSDPLNQVRRVAATALGSIGPAAVAAIPDLVKAMTQKEDLELRRKAIMALGLVGPGARAAIPELVNHLRIDQEPNADIRQESARALGRTGPDEQAIRALSDYGLNDLQPPLVRRAAAEALGNLAANSASDALASILRRDTDVRVRLAASSALQQIGTIPSTCVPDLAYALGDPNSLIRRDAAFLLGTIGPAASEAIPDLEKAKQDRDPYVRDAATDALEQILRPTGTDRLRTENWLLAIKLVLLVLTLLAIGYLLLRVIPPLWLLRLAETSLPPELRRRMVQRIVRYFPGVLDAWVKHHAPAVRTNFKQKPLVRRRELSVPLPLIGIGNLQPANSLEDLRPLFAVKRACVLIAGEAGSGKTTLACRLAEWAMAEVPEKRLVPGHLMLPVLIESGTEFPATDRPLLAAIRAEIEKLLGRAATPGEELLLELLRQQRLLVVVDGLSELPTRARKAFRFTDPHFPVNALVITSRAEESLDGAPRSTLIPQSLGGGVLVEFVKQYLHKRERAGHFTEPQLFDACLRLTRLTEGRSVTPLLAKMYTERLIAAAEAPGDGAPPDSIPELMLGHLRALDHQARAAEAAGGATPPSSATMERDAKVVAWECLRQCYRPSTVSQEVVLDALRSSGEVDASARLAYLTGPLGLFRLCASEASVRFALDPLAEYLAGLYLVEHHGTNQAAWDEFFHRQTLEERPKDSRSFLLAVRDCCLAGPSTNQVPGSVLHRLRQLTLVVTPEVQAEVVTAARQVEDLLPRGNPYRRPGVCIGHCWRQASTVSGDFYDFLPRPDGSLAIYAVDVEGHGLAASLQAGGLSKALNSAKWGQGEAHQELRRADELVRTNASFQKEDAAFCMNFTEIDPGRHELRHANAGMPFPLLFRRGATQPEILQAAGVYVGAGYGEYPIEPRQAVTRFEEGDLLVIVSDGIVEARDEKGNLFGTEGLTAAILANRDRDPAAIAEEVVRAAARHAGKPTPEDDQLVLIVVGTPLVVEEEPKMTPNRQRQTYLPGTPGELPAPSAVFQIADAAAEQNEVVLLQIEARVRGCGLVNDQRCDQVWVTVYEAVQNALRYGADSLNGSGEVHIWILPLDRNGWLYVVVRQPRPWEDWERYLGPARKLDVDAGDFLLGGTVILLWLADHVGVSDGGRRIDLHFSPAVKADRLVRAGVV